MTHLELFEGYIILQEKKKEKKWIAKAIKHSGKLHKDLDIPKDDVIPMDKIEDKIKELEKKKDENNEEGLTKKESKMLKRLNLAKTLKEFHK